MKQKRHSVEEIIRILREADSSKNVEAVCREHNITATSYYRWKKKFGGMELQDARRYRELERGKHRTQKAGGRPDAQNPGVGRGELKKMVSPLHKRRAVAQVVTAGLCSQRRACRYLGLHRSSGRYQNKGPTQWLLRLGERLEALSRKHSRLGYRKLTRMLRAEGWKVGKKLVQRLRRECGLRVKRWRPRRRRRGQSTGTIPTRAERLNHVWSWDFVADRTDNGGRLRILSLIDEHSRECLALHVARKLTAQDLVEVMERLVAERGVPEHIRSDNGSEFIARILRDWLAQRGVKTLYIEPGSPGKTGHVESFNGSLRDECLDREVMLSVAEARVLIEDYRRHYNEERPHGGIGYRTPAQARLEALASSRPPGSLRPELESQHAPVTLKT